MVLYHYGRQQNQYLFYQKNVNLLLDLEQMAAILNFLPTI